MSHLDNEHTQLITPVKIPVKDKGTGRSFTERHSWFKVLALALVFGLMVAGGALLLHYLAQNSANTAKVADSNVKPEPETKEKSAVIPEDQPTEAVDPAKLAAEKEDAEQKLAEFMRAKNELERTGVSEWGGEQIAEMIQLSQKADALLMEKDFISAAETYAEATALANTLAGQTDVVLQRLLEEGRRALDEGDGPSALQKYRLALMIDSLNELAQHGLERAKKNETVSQLLNSGKHHEKNGNLSFAHADYQTALRLDPESGEAREAVNRVKGLITGEEFQQLMSEGLAALHNNNFQLARTKLLKAKSFRPEAPEARDALAQVEQAIRLARIEDLRKNAAKAENSENWEQALKFYLAVLKTDKDIQFATQGKERSLKQIRIEKRINFFLQNPSILESDRQLEKAVFLIHEVEGIGPKGPQLTAQFKALTQLVQAAQTPVKITIESDNLTEVAVYKVGKLGRFTVRELNLRPGTYTVVGARDGYKDVRRKIVINPGQGPLRLTVKCRLKI